MNLGAALTHSDTLTEATELLEEALKLSEAKSGPEDPETLMVLNNLANAYQTAGDLVKALPLRKRLIDLFTKNNGPNGRTTLNAKYNYALGHMDAKRYAEAATLLEETLSGQRATLPPGHRSILQTMQKLSICYHRTGRADEAVHMAEESLTLCEATMSKTDPFTINLMQTLVSARRGSSHAAESGPLLEDLLQRLTIAKGPYHRETIGIMHYLAEVYRENGRLDEAVRVHAKAYALCSTNLLRTDPVYLSVGGGAAETFLAAGKFAEAGKVVQDMRLLSKPGSDQFLQGGRLLGECFLGQKRFEEAESQFRKYLTAIEPTQAGTSPVFIAQGHLGSALAGQKKFPEAEDYLLKSYEGNKIRHSANPTAPHAKQLHEAVQRLVQLHEAWNNPTKAAEWRQKL
jgi:tetratricopeptide (TPR) repeat protein